MDVFHHLISMLREAGQAHHRALAAGDGQDLEWARWYAAHLAVPVAALLGQCLTADLLAVALREAERARQSRGDDPDRARFYADRLIERYAPERVPVPALPFFQR